MQVTLHEIHGDLCVSFERLFAHFDQDFKRVSQFDLEGREVTFRKVLKFTVSDSRLVSMELQRVQSHFLHQSGLVDNFLLQVGVLVVQFEHIVLPFLVIVFEFLRPI